LHLRLNHKRQIGLMMLRLLKVRFNLMGPIVTDVSRVGALVGELRELASALREKTAELPGDDRTIDLITSVADIFACALALGDQPRSVAVQTARRLVMNTAQTKEPEANFAKSVVLCEHCRPFMSASKTRAPTGLADASLLTMYKLAVQSFEDKIPQALDDLPTYFGGNVDGTVQPLTIEKYTAD
jgi:hypothetical protein